MLLEVGSLFWQSDAEKRLKNYRRLCKFGKTRKRASDGPSSLGLGRRPHLWKSSAKKATTRKISRPLFSFPFSFNHPPNQVQLPQYLHGQQLCELPFIRQLHVGRQTKPKLILYLLLLNHQRVIAGRTERDILVFLLCRHFPSFLQVMLFAADHCP